MKDHGPGTVISASTREDHVQEHTDKQIAQLLPRLEKSFPDSTQPKAVLDFGCGVGRFEPFLANHFPNAAVFGFDNCAPMLMNAPKHPRVHYASGPWEDFCLAHTAAESRFDLIFVFMVFGGIAVEDCKRYVAGFKNILAENGKIILADHMPENFYDEDRFWRLRKFTLYKEIFEGFKLAKPENFTDSGTVMISVGELG